MSERPGIPLSMPSSVTRAPFVDAQGALTEETKKWLTNLPQQQDFKIRTRNLDSHASRVKKSASLFADGTHWVENDRSVTYASQGKTWVYSHGIYVTTSDVLPTDLGLNDVGFLVSVTDFNHSLRWNGTSWEFAPGDHGSGYIVAFVNPPIQAGWLLCDGSSGVSTLNGDGTIDNSVTLPNTPGSYYRQ